MAGVRSMIELEDGIVFPVSYESMGVELDLYDVLLLPYGFLRFGVAKAEEFKSGFCPGVIGATKSTPLPLSLRSGPVEKVKGYPGLFLPSYALAMSDSLRTIGCFPSLGTI